MVREIALGRWNATQGRSPYRCCCCSITNGSRCSPDLLRNLVDESDPGTAVPGICTKIPVPVAS